MPITAIRPGEHLAEELKALDMSASELARKVDVPTNRITQILNGLSGDTALRLAHFLALARSSGLVCKRFYDLRLAQEKSGNSIKALPTLKRTDPVHA